MLAFLTSYTTHLVAFIGGSALSGALVLYGLGTGGRGLPMWAAFLVFVAFMIGTTFRVRREEIRKRIAVEERMGSDAREYLRSVGFLKEQLTDALENLNGCPQVVLGYREATIYGFYLATTGAPGRKVQLELANSPHYVLTAECVHHIACGIPEVPLELHVELTNGEPGFIKSADGQEAWNIFASDLWSGVRPLDTSKGPAHMLNKFVHDTEATNLLIPLRLSYWDFSGKVRYTSAAEVVWEPLLGSVVEVRPGVITKELS